MSKAPQPSPALPWKVRLHLAIVSAVTDAACRANGTINRRLLNFFVVKDPPNEKPVNGVKTVDTTIDPSRNLWFRIFSPTEPSDDASLPVIVFFHGGGFAVLSSDSRDYDSVCRRIAREIPAVVISVNYRLAPENRLPSQYDDSFDTLKFLDEGNFDGLPATAKLSRCFLAGDSAGGNLSHHVVCRVSGLELRKVKVIGVISIQPFFGGEERTESEIRLAKAPLVSVQRTDWLWKAFLPEGANRDHEAVNVSGPNAADISEVKYPATIVFVGGLDPLQDRQRAYYEWLKRCGKEAYLIEYPNAVHAFYVFPELPESSLFINEARNFIQKQSSKKG